MAIAMITKVSIAAGHISANAQAQLLGVITRTASSGEGAIGRLIARYTTIPSQGNRAKTTSPAMLEILCHAAIDIHEWGRSVPNRSRELQSSPE